ncbi:MAG: DUF1385 domain-containing protein, partial [Fimbriimonadaceae bacterium]|nr:DUF1385 domain-containing protein [Fimbriimonadaceae bacterium]
NAALAREVAVTVPPIAPDATWHRALLTMRQFEVDTLAVVHDGAWVGTLSIGDAPIAEPEELAQTEVGPIRPEFGLALDSTRTEVLDWMRTHGRRSAVLRGDDDSVFGTVRWIELLLPQRGVTPLPLVGGMATPLGVYLTTGGVTGGAPVLGLVLTGMTMGSLLLAANLAIGYAQPWLVRAASGWVGRDWVGGLAEAATIAVFALGLRLSPLARIHGAEHMVVHAIEQEIPLTVATVRRMPRVHPRCGTNFAVAFTLFLTILTTPWIPHLEFRLLAAVLVSGTGMRRIGGWVQYWITTAAPKDHQIAQAIESAEALRARYRARRRAEPNPLVRVWNMGVLQVFFGTSLVLGTFSLLAWWFRWPLPFEIW